MYSYQANQHLQLDVVSKSIHENLHQESNLEMSKRCATLFANLIYCGSSRNTLEYTMRFSFIRLLFINSETFILRVEIIVSKTKYLNCLKLVNTNLLQIQKALKTNLLSLTSERLWILPHLRFYVLWDFFPKFILFCSWPSLSVWGLLSSLPENFSKCY